MSENNHDFLAIASVVLGVVVLIVCLYLDDDSMPHRTTIIWTIPAMLTVTYLSLFWLSYR